MQEGKKFSKYPIETIIEPHKRRLFSLQKASKSTLLEVAINVHSNKPKKKVEIYLNDLSSLSADCLSQL